MCRSEDYTKIIIEIIKPNCKLLKPGEPINKLWVEKQVRERDEERKKKAEKDKKKYDKIKADHGEFKFYEGEEGFDGYMFSNFSKHKIKAFGREFMTSEHLF